MRAWRSATWARPGPPNAAATRRPARSPHNAARVARGRCPGVGGIRECHPAARMLSMNSATSSISRRSSSSASSAATSAASVARRRSRSALSRIALRIASDLLRPVFVARVWHEDRSKFGVGHPMASRPVAQGAWATEDRQRAATRLWRSFCEALPCQASLAGSVTTPDSAGRRL